MGILDIQRRFHEVGRIRAGSKSDRGAPQKLDKWRLTSANRAALEAAAAVYGGTVQPWADAPTPGQWELFTDVDALDAVIPPAAEPYTLWYEAWSGGGCDRRCDGVRDHLNDTACVCNPDDRACKPTLRVSVMLTRVPGLGVWRYESHGWNAAVEVPTMLDLLALGARDGVFVPAVLRLEQRVSRKKGEGTRRFAVPVIDIQETAGDFTRTIAAGDPLPPPPSLAAPDRPAIAAPTPAALPAPDPVPDPDPVPAPDPTPADAGDQKASAAQKRLVYAKAKDAGVDRDLIPRVYAFLIERPGASMSDLLAADVDRLVRSIAKIGGNVKDSIKRIEDWEADSDSQPSPIPGAVDTAWGDAPALEF
jgi:hypothetical protein